jgi:outer membrane receptor protein involved in Fe transport
MVMWRCVRVALLLVTVLLPVTAFAQSTAEIRGIVQDESGGIIPGATVTAINELTGLERTTTSDSGGRFNIPRLPVGNYRVEVKVDGFRPFATAPFRLNVENIRQVTAVMALGALEEGITVTGQAAVVETVGGTLGEIVDERRIQELPLNGRNPLQLQVLLPGVVQAVGNAGSTAMWQMGGFSVNGLRGISNNYMLDSGDNNDVLGGTAAIVPNPDALEEFTVQTSNFSAEYGRNMGAVINAVTKSGTNRLHGSAYEFARHDAMDAKQFFAVEKGTLRRSQYGGTLGGPIVRDRMFYFGAFEGLRLRQGESRSNLVVPTALERNGDFSQSSLKPRDPLTGQPFPNNQIPRAQFDPAIVKFMDALIPLPNASGGRHIYNAPLTKDGWQVMSRLDTQLTDRQRLFGRVFYDKNELVNTNGLPVLHSEVAYATWNAAINHTHILSSHLVNAFQFTYSETDLDRGPLPVGDRLNFQKLGVNVPLATEGTENTLVPLFRGGVSGHWNLNQDAWEPDDRPAVQFKNDTSYSRGSHVLKFGGEYRWSANNRTAGNCNDPCFNFNGQYTGSPLGDFLLGMANNVQQFSVRYNKGRARAFAAYAQDDWTVNQRLTLSLGVRWEPFIAFYEVDQPQPVFRPGQKSILFPNAPLGLLYAGDPGVPRGGHPTRWANLAPRVAAAWRLNEKTSLRTAYGIFHDTARFFHYPKTLVFTPPYSISRTTNDVIFSDPYRGKPNPYPYQPPTSSAEYATYQFQLPVRVTSYPHDFSSGFSQQWNVNLQRDLGGDLVVSAAYVGTRAHDLPTSRSINNAVYGPGATLGNRQQRRLYPDFEDISSFDPIGKSLYHGLQLSVNKRFSRGYSVLASYTLSKAMDNASNDDDFNGSAQNRMDPDDTWGFSDSDQRHRLVTSVLWELPSPQTGAARAVLGGWQLNGIVTLAAGTPFTVSTGRDTMLSFETSRANVNGNPNLSTDRSQAEKIARYFDPTVFSIPANGAIGNTPRNFLIGPGSRNVDLSLFRNFALRRGMNLQFRVEAFNAFNFVNLRNPRSNIGSPDPGRIDSAGDARVMQLGLRMAF